MPWYVVRNSSECPTDKPHAVKNKDTGKLMGCHTTVFEAGKQVKALYANTKDEKK